MLEHGGRLRQAARDYQIPVEDWLDLSTGINPCGWPVPALPPSVWSRLPEVEDGLEEAARAYCGAGQILPVAGSQAAIRALPLLRPQSRVSVLTPAYAEHAAAWQRAGHWVSPVSANQLAQGPPAAEVLVIVHPNNPTGARFPLEALLDWHARLSTRGGWLLVDEAFMDATPDQSLVPHCPRPGLIVLRSLGKFFGLAGARVGFVIAEPALLARLEEHLGPWTLSTPARLVATMALSDRPWQQETRRRLATAGRRLSDLLESHGLSPDGGCDLFQWVRAPNAELLHDALARRGILTRLFKDTSSLRFGLPGRDPAWMRLASALTGAAGQGRSPGCGR